MSTSHEPDRRGGLSPLARTAKLGDRLGLDTDVCPLSAYKDSSFYTMRTDSLDRFGTRLEHRFSRAEIEKMMIKAGLEQVRFSESMPNWVAVGRRRYVTRSPRDEGIYRLRALVD